LDNKDYYHSYKDLKKRFGRRKGFCTDNSKGRNPKVKMLSAGAGECLHCFLSF